MKYVYKYKEKYIDWLRLKADQGREWIKINKEVVKEYLNQKEYEKRVENIRSKDFLQSLCNSGLQLYQDGKTV